MADIDKVLEKEIIDLKSDIEKIFIDLRQEDMSEDLRDLRHKVFNAHTEIEGRMYIALFLDLLHAADPKDTMKSISPFMGKIRPILSNLSFMKLLSLYKEIKDPENIIQANLDKISKLNDIRVEFAHPRKGGYKKYNDRLEYKKALEVIKSAFDAFKPKNS